MPVLEERAQVDGAYIDCHAILFQSGGRYWLGRYLKELAGQLTGDMRERLVGIGDLYVEVHAGLKRFMEFDIAENKTEGMVHIRVTLLLPPAALSGRSGSSAGEECDLRAAKSEPCQTEEEIQQAVGWLEEAYRADARVQRAVRPRVGTRERERARPRRRPGKDHTSVCRNRFQLGRSPEEHALHIRGGRPAFRQAAHLPGAEFGNARMGRAR